MDASDPQRIFRGWLICALSLMPAALLTAEPAVPTLFRRIEIPEQLLTTKTVDGETLSASGDMRLGDLDGDGRAELVIFRATDGVKPSFLGAISLEGKLLWQLGTGGDVPVRSGPVALYDFDGDGADEIVCFCHVPKVKAEPSSLANVRIQIRSGASGELVKQSAPPELTSCQNPDPTWAEHYNWIHQRLLVANLRGGDRPRDIVVKVAGRVIAFDDSLRVLWKYDLPEIERPYHPAFVPAVGDVNGDGRDEIFLGHLLLSADGKPLWEQRRTPNTDSVQIAPWDNSGMKTISSGAGEVLDAGGNEIVSTGRRMIPHGREIRVADFVADSPGLELVIRNEGTKTGAIIVSSVGDILRRFKLNNSPGDIGLEVVLWNGPEGEALIYNGGALWEGSGKLFAELKDLPVAVGPADQGWYHCLPADVAGDAREELVLFNPWDKYVWIFTAGEIDSNISHAGYNPGPRQYNPRISD